MLQFELLWAFALVPLPVLVYWLSPEYRDSGEAMRAPFFKRLVEVTGQQPKPGAVVLRKDWLQRANFVAIWLLLVTALAQPVYVGDPIIQEKSARDLLLIVDLSQSMEEKDFTNELGEKISRVDAVKLVLGDFIERRDTDRLGLAVFGTQAFPLAPFTEDHDTVRALLSELRTSMAGPRTMIGDAIGLAIKLFEPSEAENKVVIFLTDGNDTGSQIPVVSAADIAGENGITIHTISMGDPTTIGEKELDLDVLQNVADATGGEFFLALNSGELLSVYDELDKLEAEKLEVLSYRPKRSLFHIPLGIMMVLNLFLSIYLLRSSRAGRQADA